MNHELIIILMHLKSHTFMNSKLCNFMCLRDTCLGVHCNHCILITCSVTSDKYVARLLFRTPI